MFGMVLDALKRLDREVCGKRGERVLVQVPELEFGPSSPSTLRFHIVDLPR